MKSPQLWKQKNTLRWLLPGLKQCYGLFGSTPGKIPNHIETENQLDLQINWSDCNWTRTQNHLVLKRTLNHLVNEKSCLWWSVNLARGDLNCSYWGGLKLIKLVINDWVHVFPRVVSGNSGRVGGLWNDM